MLVKKITHGFVIQVFDMESLKCVSQEFVAGDQVEFEDEAGKPVEGGGGMYYPFEMKQPEQLDETA